MDPAKVMMDAQVRVAEKGMNIVPARDILEVHTKRVVKDIVIGLAKDI